MAKAFLEHITEPLEELKKPFSKAGCSKMDSLHLWLGLINLFDAELKSRGVELPNILNQVEQIFGIDIPLPSVYHT